MPSSLARGAYGTGKRVKDWNNYNPLGVKIVPYPYGNCALCDKRDIIFPVQLKICERCTHRIAEKPDIMKRIQYRKVVLSGWYCEVCNAVTPLYFGVNTRICNSCTIRLGKNERKRIQWMERARRVDANLDIMG